MTPFEFFSLLIQFGMLVIAFLTYYVSEKPNA